MLFCLLQEGPGGASRGQQGHLGWAVAMIGAQVTSGFLQVNTVPGCYWEAYDQSRKEAWCRGRACFQSQKVWVWILTLPFPNWAMGLDFLLLTRPVTVKQRWMQPGSALKGWKILAFVNRKKADGVHLPLSGICLHLCILTKNVLIYFCST